MTNNQLKEDRDLIGRYNRLTIQPVIELASGAMTMDMLLAAQDLISRHEERARCAKIVLDCRCSCNCEKFDDYVLVEEVADKILNPSNHE